MRRMKTHVLTYRLMAVLLCLCMMMSMISGFGEMKAVAADTRAAEPTEDIVPESRVADPDTMDDYQNRLLTDDSGSRYAGRVWTDKTVFAYKDGIGVEEGSHFDGDHTITMDMDTDGYIGDVSFNSDFGHVFSALASSQVVNEYPPSPIDMVLVLDISSSMGDDTEPAEGSIWAEVYTALEDYFNGAGQSQLSSLPEYDTNHYLQFELLTETTEGVTGTKNFIKSEFPKETRFESDTNLDNEGKMSNMDTVKWFLETYKAGGYIHRIDNDPNQDWEYVSEQPAEREEYRKVLGVQIRNDSIYWINDGTEDGKELTQAQGAARQAFEHTRFLNLIYSANNVIEQLMENNPENRVSVVVYDRRATVVMPLAHYDKNTTALSKIPAKAGYDGTNYVYDSKWLGDNPQENDGVMKAINSVLGDEVFGYLCPFFDGHDSSDSHPTSYVSVNSARVVAKPREELAADGVTSTETQDFGSDGNGLLRIAGTNTHAGLTAGLEQLANAKDTTLTAKLSDGSTNTVPRIPAAIIMTDGGSNTVANGPWYDPDYAIPVQRSDHKNDWSSVVVTQYMLTAAYLKSAVEKNYDKYMELGHDQDLPVYTVGVDLRDDTDNWVPARLYPMMDPKDYFTDADNLPPTTIHPGGTTIDLGNDTNEDESNPGNKELIVNAYKNWTDWSAGTDQEVSDIFGVAEKTNEGLFQQNESSSSHTYDPYIIPFEQDEVNVTASSRKLQAWNGVLGSISYKNLQYNTLWHGWSDGEVTNPTTAAVNFESSNLPLVGTATFWSFDEAKGTTGEAYQAGGNSYQAEYLADRTITYDDTSGSISGAEEKVRAVSAVTQDDMKDNINYVTKFYDVSSAQMNSIFEEILAEVLGQVFVPISGDNDAGVGDSITYQDPLGEYMEIKNASITATPHHVDEGAIGEGEPQTYDMALLVFGEMHGLVRTGVYDYHWNDEWIGKNFPDQKGKSAMTEGWYLGDDPKEAISGGPGAVPTGEGVEKEYTSAADARADGWIYRLSFNTAAQFIPILSDIATPSDIPTQMQNTVYTMYRFAGDTDDRNALHRNPIYGDVPDDLKATWDTYKGTNDYPDDDTLYSSVPGVYRLSDIRVWVEEYGNYTDTAGAIAPNSGYDRSLYVNIPAAAIPTELATITLGENGVMAYQTNIGADHPDGTDEGTANYVSHEEYCYQSTPFRLFYAVGLEDDLILHNASGNQVGVDVSSISPEYIQAHTDATTGNVWFISNYYSETRYSGYATDDTSRTRGDPTVTFSPGIDNRYYVFQKPLPLYAHAYRVNADGTGGAVDNIDGYVWGSESSSNGKTTWEDGNAGGASWQGGQFMGVYETQLAFQQAYENYKASGGNTITDSHGSVYEFVDGGIIFSEEDLLDHVTSAEGGGYEAGSHSFSSDDYYFILLEFYVPTEGGTGTDRDGEKIDGSHTGKFVQWALARKGSEFGSGYASSNISNGDMLCWTDMDGLIDTNFTYMSATDTGDRTRGEPTFEKLTFKNDEGQLRNYLKNECGIDPTKTIPNPNYDPDKESGDDNPENLNLLDEQVKYWLARQEDPQVIAALEQARNKAEEAGETELNKDNFSKYLQFALATRPGGIRSGDMSNNLQYKGTIYTDGYYNNNNTKTSNTYYLPTISNNSGTDNNVIINNFLGNNGRLEIANETLHVTKILVPPDGYKLTDEQEDEDFNFQVSIQGVTGTRSAVKTEYNEYAGSWERELAYIDVLTDNSDLVQTNSSTRALFVKVNGTTSVGDSILARQVVLGDDGRYYYANDDGTQSEKLLEDQGETLYYMYLPSNGVAGTDTEHVHRLYQAEDYEGTDKIESDLGRNGITTFVREGDPTTSAEAGEANRNSRRTADDVHPAGTKTYWNLDAELIPVEEVREDEGSNDLLTGSSGEPGGIATMALEEASGGTWTHDETHPGDHAALTYHDFFVRKPIEGTSESQFTSPYKSRTQYLTVSLNFGQNANENDITDKDKDTLLVEEDLYNSKLFGSVDTIERLLQITAEFTLKHGEGLMFDGLSGAAYRFTEQLTEDQATKGYKLQQIEQIQQSGPQTYTDTDSVDGDTGFDEEQVNYTNTFQPGDIFITKNLVAKEGATITDEDKASEFSFTLEIDPSKVGEPADGTYSYTVTNEEAETVKTGRLLPHDVPKDLKPEQNENDIQAKEDGTWEFTLKGGETMSVDDLPTKSGFTYTITETTEGDGYEVTDNDAEPGNKDKTVTGEVGLGSDDPVKVEFTNTKQKPEPVSVSLNLKKTVSGTGFDWTGKEFAFLVAPAAGNPEGDPFTEAKEVKVSSENETVDIFKDLQFEKPGIYTYTIREIQSEIPGISTDGKVYTVQVAVAEEYDDAGIYAGKLKATVTVDGESTTEPITVTFNNQYDKNKIEVPFQARKVLEGGVLTDGAFHFTLECTAFEPEEVAATVSISEGDEEPDGGTGTSSDQAAPASVGVGTAHTEGNDSNGLIDFGYLEFTQAGTYTFKMSEQIGTEPGVDYDTQEYTVTVVIVRDPDTGALKLESINYDPDVAEFELPTFTNKVKTGSLTVEKQVTGEGDKTKGFHFTVIFDPRLAEPTDLTITKFDAAGENIGEEFNVDTDGKLEFTLKDGEKLTITGLPVNTVYTVEEDDYSGEGYTTTITDPEGDPDGSGTIRADQEDEVTVVNDKPTTPPPPPSSEYGNLTVTKTVTGGAGDTNKEWHFRVELNDTSITGQYGDLDFTNGVAEFTLKHGQSATAQNLPADVTYTVTETEANADGYTTTVTDNDGANDGQGTIAANATDEVSFVNGKPTTPPPPTKNYGNLVVTKTVTGSAGDTNREWHFRVELSDKSVSGQYGDLNFTNGVAEFTLKHGQSVTAQNLPEGVTYTVTETEADQDGYDTASSGETGTIPNGGTANAQFVNDKPDNPDKPDKPDEPDKPDKPDKPDNPDKPDQPDKPDNPDNPNNPGTPGNPNNPDNPPDDVPRTGDDNHAGMWWTLLFFSLLCAAVTAVPVFGRRRITSSRDGHSRR